MSHEETTMTTMSGDERLAALIREHMTQTEAWERVKATIASLGDVTLAVPTELLDQVEEACRAHVSLVTDNLSIRA